MNDLRSSETRAASSAVELFPTAGPLATDELIGRDDVVAGLVEDLDAGVHRVLTGADVSGKTSVALAALAGLGAEWDVVGVDLFRTPSPLRLIAAVLGDRADGAAVESIGEALAMLDADAAANGRRIALFVDSFHELATTQIFGKIGDVGKDLRTALDATTHTTCLFVGGASTVMRDLFTSKGQPFHQLAPVTTLARIERHAWLHGLAQRFDRGGCSAGDAALGRLLDVGEQHARSTMLIAQHAYALAAAAGRSSLSVGVVDAGVESALAGEQALFDHRLAQVRALSKHALSTALRVATGESPYKQLPPAMARQTLRGLETAGVVEHPKSGVYAIGDPLLRRYLVDLAAARGPVAGPHPTINPAFAAALDAIRPAPQTSPITEHAIVSAVEQSPDPTVSVAPRPDAVIAIATPAADVPSVVAAPVQEPPGVEVPVVEAPIVVEQRAPDAPIIVELPAVEPPETEHLVVEPATAAAEHASEAEVASAPAAHDARGLRLRHPRPEEAELIGDCVTSSLDGDQFVERSPGSAVGDFVSRTVADDPNQYWQVEAGRRPVGGVVLHQPGTGARRGLDPVVHAAILAGTAILLIIGLALLVIGRAWNWGAYAGLIFAAFIAAGVQIAQLAPRVLARARASITARRRGGRVVAAVWSEPDAMPEVFRQLARHLPGTHLSGYVESPGDVAAYRAVGFCVRRNRLAEGVLDPDAARPVRSSASPTAATAPQRRPSDNGPTPAEPSKLPGPPPRAAVTRASAARRSKHRRRSTHKAGRR